MGQDLPNPRIYAPAVSVTLVKIGRLHSCGALACLVCMTDEPVAKYCYVTLRVGKGGQN